MLSRWRIPHKNTRLYENHDKRDIVQLPVVYDINLAQENTTSNEYFNFVIWNPCADKYRYFLNPHSHIDHEWYLMSNGSILRPKNSKEPIHDYHQYCLARINSTEYREYLAFLCTEKSYEVPNIISFGMLVSVPFLIATYIIYWLLPEKLIAEKLTRSNAARIRLSIDSV